MKLLLKVENGSLAGKEFELEGGSLLLGRSQECNLRFDFKLDPGVSSRHATIRKDQDGFRLVDEHSTNGTLLNNAPAQDSPLRSGDVIRLGPQGPILHVTIQEMRVESTMRFDQPPQLEPATQFIAPQQAPAPPPASQPSPPPAAQQPPAAQPAPPVAPPAPGSALKNVLSSFGSIPATEAGQRQKSMIGCIAGAMIGGFFMLLVAGIMIWQLGIVGAFVGGFMALLPAPFYLFVMLWIDRYDPEPGWAIAASFAWGALVAVLVSFVMNTLFGTAMGSIAGGEQGSTLSSIISAPIFEEGSKGMGVLLLLLLLRSEFDGVVDGIFYAGVIALGFATFENILYYGGTYLNYGFGGLIRNVFDRGLLAPFSHALFTSMTGIGCGISRESHNKTVRFLAPPIGYVLAMILHGFWNAIASAVGGVGYYIAYVMVWIPLFLIFLAGVVAVARREQKIIKRMLEMEVTQTLITAEQLQIITSLVKRTSWLLSSAQDLKKLNARRKFLRSATKLAFSYWHMELAAKDQGQTMSAGMVGKYQADVRALQSQI